MSRLDELKQELEWRKCAEDEQYFLKNYWHIAHPERGAIKFELRDVQATILETWQNEQKSISLKARQIGWSTLVAAHVFWVSFFNDARPVVMLSKKQDDSRDLLQKSRYGYDRLPAWMIQRGPALTNDSVDKMKFANGSQIESLPSRKDPARGKSVHTIVLDEWAFFEDPENAWAAIEPTIDIGGRVIAISTANGAGNFFHKTYDKAKAGLNGFKALFFAWDSVPERDPSWYEQKARELPEWQLHQEYPRSDIEAFLRSGHPVFSVDVLMEMSHSDPRTGELYDLNGWDFLETHNGSLKVWQDLRPEGVYVIGADTAAGLEYGDFASSHVIRVPWASDDGEIMPATVVAVLHGRYEPDVFGEQLFALGSYYNNALIGVEANSHGLPTLLKLRDLRYPKIFKRRVIGKKHEKRTKDLGWWTDRKSKPLMIDDLSAHIREGSLEINDLNTVEELLTYVRAADGSTSGSPNDDRVMSLAVAVQMMRYQRSKRQRVTDSGPPPESLEWHLEQLKLSAVPASSSWTDSLKATYR